MISGVSVGVSVAATPAVGEASIEAGQAAAADSHAAPRPAPSGRKVTARHPARHAPRPTSLARHAKPYLIYDSVTPAAIPGNHEIATYATGAGFVSAAQVAGRGPILWIDVTGTDPAASALDVEPGCASPPVAANWTWRKLAAEPNAKAILYTSRSEWPALQAAVATLPARMRARVRWWIADPTGYPHIVPGSDATQWYWGRGYDITTASPDF